MHKTIYIYHRFFARQPQLKALNGNKRMVTHLLVEPGGKKYEQSILGNNQLDTQLLYFTKPLL
jgi:hypothetical protein